MKKLALCAALMFLFAPKIAADSPYITIFKDMIDNDGVQTQIYKMFSEEDIKKIMSSEQSLHDKYPDYEVVRKNPIPSMFALFCSVCVTYAGTAFLIKAVQGYSQAKKSSDYIRIVLQALSGFTLLAAANSFSQFAEETL